MKQLICLVDRPKPLHYATARIGRRGLSDTRWGLSVADVTRSGFGFLLQAPEDNFCANYARYFRSIHSSSLNRKLCLCGHMLQGHDSNLSLYILTADFLAGEIDVSSSNFQKL